MKHEDTAEGLSRPLHELAGHFGLTADQSRALGKVATAVGALGAANVAQVAEAVGLDREAATKLIEAARLMTLPKVPTKLALELVRQGLTLSALADTPLSELLKRFEGNPSVPPERVAVWAVAAAASQGGAPDLTEPKDPRPQAPQPPARLVMTRATSWTDLAKELYGLKDKEAQHWGTSLALVNHRSADERIAPGSVVALPNTDKTRPKLPDREEAVKKLQSFAPDLRGDVAEKLVAAGIFEPLHLVATVRNPDAITASVSGVAEVQLRQLQTHALLSSSPDIGADLAYYLAFTRPRTLKDLQSTDAVTLSRELERATILGDLRLAKETDPRELARAILVFIGKFFPPAIVFLPGETAVCSREVPASAHLENYYSVRFAPAGRTAEALRLELQAKNQWLSEVDDYFAQPQQAQGAVATTAFAERGLRLARIHLDDLRKWGGTVFDTTRIETLTLLRDFMRESARIVDLLQALAEGHESFHVREYGLALAAYSRAEAWFTALAPREDPPGSGEIWWRNRTVGGVDKPAFLDQYEQMPGDMTAELTYKPVHDYYVARRAAADRTTLLETLHVDLSDYHSWRLFAALVGMPTVPFVKFLYYINNFVVPVAKGDCYARLGNYCTALDNYMRVHRDDVFTGSMAAGPENTLVTGVLGAAGPSYPSLSSFSVPATTQDQYYSAYLNDVERRVVRLRVAELLLSWGDSHFRRRELEEAKARYAQVIRVLFTEWNAIRAVDFTDVAAYRASVDATGANPRAASLAMAAHHQLLKIARGLNFLGYAEDYVPIWTYTFLLSSARYFAERARQLGRDAVQFLSAAEQEQGNRRLLQQQVGVAQGQLAVESRRVDEAEAAHDVALAGEALADQRVANNAAAKEDLEAFGPIRQTLGIVGGAVGGAGSGAGIGGLAGGAGGAAGAVAGATFGAVSSYISGCVEMQAQRNELERQRLEMQKASAMSAAEVNRAQIGTSVARLARNVAALNSIYAQSNLEFAQAKTLNAEFWYETAARMADIAKEYLERAIGVSFLAEQSFEFMEGRRLDVIRFDYSQAEGVLSAEALLADLDGIEFERISGRLSKSMPVKHVIRLREKDFAGFLELKRTGSATIDTSLFEFDAVHPGAYHQRIAQVELEVRALVPPEGIRGTLRKAGVSYLRYRVGAAGLGAAPPNTQPDWIQHTPSAFRVAPMVQPTETLILSAFDARRDSVVLRPDPGEQLRLFEGSGIGTNWTVSLSPCSNSFDLSTVTDVNLIIYYYAQFDETLARTIELERRKLFALQDLVLQQTRGFSLKEGYPDQMYALHNPPPESPEDHWQQRSLTVVVRPGQFPPSQVNRKLQGVTLIFLGPDGNYLSARAEITGDGHTWAPADFAAAPGLDPNVRAASGFDREPASTWQLRIRAADNVGALTLPGLYQVSGGRVVLGPDRQPLPDGAGVPAFDLTQLSRIKDIVLIFNYRYEKSGECGDPLVLWAHFGTSPNATVVDAGAPQASTWLSDAIVGAPSWNLVQGLMTQTVPGASGLLSPTADLDLADVRVSARIHIPAGAGRSAGLVVRYAQPGGGAPSGDFLRARLTRLPANTLQVAMDARIGGVFNTLAHVDSTALDALESFDLSFMAVDTTLRVELGGRPVLDAQNPGGISGSVALFASGDGVSFSEVLVASLDGR